MKKYIEINSMISGCIPTENNTIIVWERLYNNLCSYDLLNNELNVIRSFEPDEIGDFKGLNVYKKNNSIYIAGQFSLQVLVYNMADDSFMLLGSSNTVHYSTFADDNKIVFIPMSISEKSFVFEYATGEFSEIKWNKDNLESSLISSIVCDDRYAYFSINKTNKIIKMNKLNYEYEIILCDNSDTLSGICLDNNNTIWCVSEDKYLLHITEKNIERIKLTDSTVENAFYNIAFEDNKIICIPRFSPEILIYDIVNKSTEHIEYVEENSSVTTASFWGYVMLDEKVIILLTWGQFKSCKIDLNTFKSEFYKSFVTDKTFGKYFMSDFVMEEDGYSLDSFICRVNLNKKMCSDSSFKHYGEEIFSELKRSFT